MKLPVPEETVRSKVNQAAKLKCSLSEIYSELFSVNDEMKHKTNSHFRIFVFQNIVT